MNPNIKRITEVHIYTCIDNDIEGVPALEIDGKQFPLVFTNISSEEFRAKAIKEFKRLSDKKLTHYVFKDKVKVSE